MEIAIRQSTVLSDNLSTHVGSQSMQQTLSSASMRLPEGRQRPSREEADAAGLVQRDGCCDPRASQALCMRASKAALHVHAC